MENNAELKLLEKLQDNPWYSTWRAELKGSSCVANVIECHDSSTCQKLLESLGKQVRFSKILRPKDVSSICLFNEMVKLDNNRIAFCRNEVKGTPLDKLLKEKEPQYSNPEKAVDLIIKVSKIIAEAHNSYKLFHGNLNPANIIIGADGEPVIIEWDAMKIVASLINLKLAEGKTIPLGDSLGGTATYMPPEQCRGEKIDEKCDIYALGVILYQLINHGKTPFDEAHDEMELMRKKMEPIDILSDLKDKEELSDIIEKAVDADGNNRYLDVNSFIEALVFLSSSDNNYQEGESPRNDDSKVKPSNRKKVNLGSKIGFAVLIVAIVIFVIKGVNVAWQWVDEAHEIRKLENNLADIQAKNKGKDTLDDLITEYLPALLDERNKYCSKKHISSENRLGSRLAECDASCATRHFRFNSHKAAFDKAIISLEETIDRVKVEYLSKLLEEALKETNDENYNAIKKEFTDWIPLQDIEQKNPDVSGKFAYRIKDELEPAKERFDFNELRKEIQKTIKDDNNTELFPSDLDNKIDEWLQHTTVLSAEEREANKKEVSDLRSEARLACERRFVARLKMDLINVQSGTELVFPSELENSVNQCFISVKYLPDTEKRKLEKEVREAYLGAKKRIAEDKDKQDHKRILDFINKYMNEDSETLLREFRMLCNKEAQNKHLQEVETLVLDKIYASLEANYKKIVSRGIIIKRIISGEKPIPEIEIIPDFFKKFKQKCDSIRIYCQDSPMISKHKIYTWTCDYLTWAESAKNISFSITGLKIRVGDPEAKNPYVDKLIFGSKAQGIDFKEDSSDTVFTSNDYQSFESKKDFYKQRYVVPLGACCFIGVEVHKKLMLGMIGHESIGELQQGIYPGIDNNLPYIQLDSTAPAKVMGRLFLKVEGETFDSWLKNHQFPQK